MGLLDTVKGLFNRGGANQQPQEGAQPAGVETTDPPAPSTTETETTISVDTEGAAAEQEVAVKTPMSTETEQSTPTVETAEGVTPSSTTPSEPEA